MSGSVPNNLKLYVPVGKILAVKNVSSFHRLVVDEAGMRRTTLIDGQEYEWPEGSNEIEQTAGR